MTDEPHSGLHLSVDERIDYLAIVASIAAVDAKLDNAEKDKLRALCKQLEIPDDRVREVLDVAERPTASLEPRFDRLKTSDLRFALLSDCLHLALADGKYAAEEQAEVEGIATKLGISSEQLEALKEAATQAAEKAAPASGSELGARLASLGIPVATLGAVSAIGVGTSGAATGAAAVGLGLTAATGFGLALGVGIGTAAGVRWLAKKLG